MIKFVQAVEIKKKGLLANITFFNMPVYSAAEADKGNTNKA